MDTFASIRIGYKSLLNDFFYVDHAAVERFGIEDEFLTPLYKLSDLDDTSYFQTGLTPSRWLFNCKKEPADLRNTGASRYIEWGRRQLTRPRKQTERAVRWPDAPALEHARHWYWPAAIPHTTRIAMRKAVGQRYAPFLFEQATLLDQRLYLVVPEQEVHWKLVAAYLSSSLFPLSLEVGANLSLGIGYLTLGTQAFRRLPALDLLALGTSAHRTRVLTAADALFASPPPEAAKYRDNPPMLELDRALLACAGVPEERAESLAAEVAHFAHVRRRLELLKDAATVTTTAADVGEVAGTIAATLRPWLEARRFPEDFIPAEKRLRLVLPSSDLTVFTDPLFEQASIKVLDPAGEVQFDDTRATAVVEVALRALQLGRRDFEIPTEIDDANRALDALGTFLDEFDLRFQDALARTSLGSKYESQVRDRVLDQLNVSLDGLRVPMEHAEWPVRRLGTDE